MSERKVVPTGFIVTEFIVSDTSGVVKEKLKALHSVEAGWLAHGNEGWIGTRISSLIPRHATPEDMRESFAIQDRVEGDSGIDFFVICPWYESKACDGGKTYVSVRLYPHYVILTNKGKLIVLIRDTPTWSSTCLSDTGPQT